MISYLKQISIATHLLWLGWFLMLIGLFLPVINIPIPDPHMAQLLFFGLPIPKVGDNGEVAILTHAPIEGIRAALFLFFKTIKHTGISISWGLLLLLSVPVLLALFAPVLLRIRSKAANIVVALCFGLGFLGPGMMLLLSANEAVIGPGFYCWVFALLLLALSRIKACLETSDKV